MTLIRVTVSRIHPEHIHAERCKVLHEETGQVDIYVGENRTVRHLLEKVAEAFAEKPLEAKRD